MDLKKSLNHPLWKLHDKDSIYLMDGKKIGGR